MEFYISKHAVDQMNLRGVKETLVWEILNNPDQVIINEDKTIYQSVG
jgi:hypothetical protein